MEEPGKVHQVDYKYLFGGADQFFKLTNEYTGSLPAKNGTKGIFADAFRYRVWISTEEEELKCITAEWHFGCYAYDKTDPEKRTEAEFELSEEGAALAVAWLQEAYDNA